jgi:D-methionine transport system ATP-binding protein
VLAGIPRAEARARALEILAWVGLADRAETYPGQLSGGQRQRVAIARGLVTHPELLLTDEPTSALDPETTGTVLELLRRVRDELGVTILLVTHEMASVRALCDRVAVLDAGEVVEEGPARDVLLRPQSVAARRLLGTVPAAPWNPPAGSAAARLSLQFLGPVAGEPLLWELGRRFGLTVNVLAGQIDRSTATPYGSFVVDVAGSGEALAGAVGHLRGRGVEVAELEAV